MKRPALFLIPLLLLASACGARMAATPADQARLDTASKLTALSSDFVSTSSAYVTKCGSIPHQLDVASCNDFAKFSTKFKADYSAAVADWHAGKNVSAEVAATMMRMDLQPFADKVK